MKNIKFLGWFGCFLPLFYFCRTDGIYRSESVCVRLLNLFILVQSQSPKPALGFLIAGQGERERQGWLARGEFGFSMSDISLNEALSGTRLAGSGDPLEAGEVTKPKLPCH